MTFYIVWGPPCAEQMMMSNCFFTLTCCSRPVPLWLIALLIIQQGRWFYGLLLCSSPCVDFQWGSEISSCKNYNNNCPRVFYFCLFLRQSVCFGTTLTFVQRPDVLTSNWITPARPSFTAWPFFCDSKKTLHFFPFCDSRKDCSAVHPVASHCRSSPAGNEIFDLLLIDGRFTVLCDAIFIGNTFCIYITIVFNRFRTNFSDFV